MFKYTLIRFIESILGKSNGEAFFVKCMLSSLLPLLSYVLAAELRD